jgi:chromosome segregation ATPase
MTKIYSKYLYMLPITIISLVLLNGGCATQPERIVTLEKKLDTLSKSVEGLEPEINVLREKLDKQESGIESTLSSQRNARSHLEKGLSETENLLKEIKENLALAEEDKSKMNDQIEELRTQLNRLETLSKLTGSKTSLTRDLLDKAIKLYQQGKFEDAISKWEEVVAHNPDKLDAKFFIEIAKDRIKEKQIHEEMKALLIQRK